MSTHDVGSRSEAVVLAVLLRAGYSVLVPYNVCRYDLAFDDRGVLRRVQVKTGRLHNGTLLFKTYSTPGGGSPVYYTPEEVDYFGVYSPDLDKVYLVPIADMGKSGGSLRIEPTRNNQSAGIIWAAQYEVRFGNDQLVR